MTLRLPWREGRDSSWFQSRGFISASSRSGSAYTSHPTPGFAYPRDLLHQNQDMELEGELLFSRDTCSSSPVDVLCSLGPIRGFDHRTARCSPTALIYLCRTYESMLLEVHTKPTTLIIRYRHILRALTRLTSTARSCELYWRRTLRRSSRPPRLTSNERGMVRVVLCMEYQY